MRRALAIFAHPDDLEFLAAGTFIHWAQQGWETGLVLLTSGNRGSNDPQADPAAIARTREAESRAAAQMLGIRTVVFLGRDDGTLVHDLALRRDITREIRRFRPDVVVSQDPTQIFYQRFYINHPDHRAAGEAVLAAIYPSAKKPLMFPELLAEGFPAHLVSELRLAASPNPDLFIDIESVLDQKTQAVLTHASQFDGDQAVVGFIHELAREAARGTPLTHAEAFRTVELRRRSYAADPPPDQPPPRR